MLQRYLKNGTCADDARNPWRADKSRVVLSWSRQSPESSIDRDRRVSTADRRWAGFARSTAAECRRCPSAPTPRRTSKTRSATPRTSLFEKETKK